MSGLEDDLAARAQNAASSGDLASARGFLEQLAQGSSSAEHWLSLASICRALGDSRAALAAIHKALSLNPLDFMGLLSRAMLLEQMASDEADEAYGRALAQRPAGLLPPQMERALAHGESRYAAYTEGRSAELAKLLLPCLAEASTQEAARISRFRTNSVRVTRPYHSEPTHFHFPSLVEKEFHDRSDFHWLSELEAATEMIATEFSAMLASERAELVPYIQYAEHEPLDQWRSLNRSRDWTAIHLLQNGIPIEPNARHCPGTISLLGNLPQPKIAGCSPNAMFSLLAPGTNIPPHTGVTNTRLVCHLPLIIPEGCWFRVGAETRDWVRGNAFVFDDTIEHEASNPSAELRVVLIFDIWHPGLAPTEREAVRTVLEADALGASLAL
jgi:aspartyl/asparaginyl beta-hydroxylase (cupin superfamily)